VSDYNIDPVISGIKTHDKTVYLRSKEREREKESKRERERESYMTTRTL
jgi:hypothetical protein